MGEKKPVTSVTAEVKYPVRLYLQPCRHLVVGQEALGGGRRSRPTN